MARSKRYLAEFDFRYSFRVGIGFNDVQRAELALQWHPREAPHSKDSLRHHAGMAGKQKRKPMPTKQMTQAEQSDRFKETARKLATDESGEAFERAFARIISRQTKSPTECVDDDDQS